MANYYEILGIDKSANEQEIKKAYRRLAMKLHPDRNPGNKSAEEEFKKVNEAYAVLSDRKKKQEYDMFGDQQFHQRFSSEDIFRGTDFSSIFEEFGLGGNSFFSSFFGGSGGGTPVNRRGGFAGSARGQDVEYPLQISFLEPMKDLERRINFQLSDGTERDITLKIPAGVNSGAKLRVQGKGANSPLGGQSGDLYIKIDVAAHPNFRRNNSDIEGDLSLKISEALLGCSAEVVTPDGAKKIKVPAGVRPGTKIRLKNLGFPVTGRAGERGDFYATVNLEIPKRLSKEQLEAVEALEAIGL